MLKIPDPSDRAGWAGISHYRCGRGSLEKRQLAPGAPLGPTRLLLLVWARKWWFRRLVSKVPYGFLNLQPHVTLSLHLLVDPRDKHALCRCRRRTLRRCLVQI